ncbi:hypothetical protein WA158_003053 [Blastocystis sp. Blastoise]
MRFWLTFLFILFVVADKICVDNTQLWKIHRYYAEDSAEEFMEIYRGSPDNGTLVFSANGVDKDHQYALYEVCLSNAFHTFVALDKANNGWATRSYFQIKSPQGVLILQGTLTTYRRREWEFHPNLPIPLGSIWKYTDEDVSASDWTSPTYTDVRWLRASKGSFSNYTTITRYYRYTGVLPEYIEEFPLLEFGVNAVAGFAIYLNGKLSFQHNMKENSGNNDPATAIDTTSYTLRERTSYNLDQIRNSTIITMAIEVHIQNQLFKTTDIFDAYFIPIYGKHIDRVAGGSVSSDHGQDKKEEGIDNAFDFEIMTMWYASSLPAFAEFTFYNDRNEWINYYRIFNGHNSSAYNPTSWRVWGLHNTGQYYLIDSQSDVTFDAFSVSKTFPLNTNTYHFNSIKFEFLTSRSGELEIGEIRFGVDEDKIAPVELTYPLFTYAFTVGMENIHIAPSSSGFGSFRYSGDLPKGILFNNDTGIFSGVADNTLASTVITIEAIHSASVTFSTTTFTISFSSCDLPNKRFDIIKRNSKWGNGAEEIIQLYNPKGKLVKEAVGYSTPTTEYYNQTYQFCLPGGVYLLNMLTTDAYGWAHGSAVYVRAYEYNIPYTIARRGLLKMTQDSFVFNTEFEDIDISKGYFNTKDLGTNWMKKDFDEKDFNDYSINQNVLATNGVWYFRMHYNVTFSDHVQGFEFRVKARAGVLIYLNEVEVYRMNLPEGDIKPTSQAINGVAATEEPSWFVYTGLIKNLPIGQHLFAIALVSRETVTSAVVDFQCTLRLLTETDKVTRTWGVTGTQSNSVSSDTNANRLFDQNYYSRFATYLDASHPAPQWAMSTFNNYRQETINAYCVANSWESPATDPIEWQLFGSNNNQNWDLLDSQHDIYWTERSQRQCFYMYKQNKSYNQIKFAIMKASVAYPDNNQVVIAELQYYLYDYSKLVIPDLVYTPTEIIDYVNTPLSTITPSSQYYTNFSIMPQLPNGVYLDTGSGVIYGTPTESIILQYTISATGPKGDVKTTLKMTITECKYPNVYFYIEFTGLSEDNTNNKFTLVNDEHKVIDEYKSFPAFTPSFTIRYCEVGDIYSLTVEDMNGDGWGSGSYTIYLSDHSELGNGSLLRGEFKRTTKFTTEYLIYPGAGQWRYYASDLLPSPLWNTYDYNDADWPVGTPGHFDDLHGITQYYRYIINLPDLSQYVSYEFMVTVKGGVAVYLDSKLIYKYHLPSYFTGKTLPTGVFTEPTRLFSSGNIQFANARNGYVIFAVEIHSPKNSPEYSFDGSFILNLDNKNLIVDGIPKSNVDGYDGGYVKETVDRAFDGMVTTKYVGISDCTDHYIQWEYNNKRKEVATKLVFIRGDNDLRLPDNLLLVGTNDEVNWDYLYWQKNVSFGEYNTVNGTKTFNFYNDISYNTYRLYMSRSKCRDGLEVAEIELYATILKSYCVSDGIYDSQVPGEYSYMPCPDYYEGIRSRYCKDNAQWGEETLNCVPQAPVGIIYSQRKYRVSTLKAFTTPVPTIMAANYYVTISPSLPKGLSIHNTTGVISGTTAAVYPTTIYTITVTNTEGSVSTEISISYEAPFTSNSIGIAIFAGVIIVTILFIVYYLLNKKGKLDFLKRNKGQVRIKASSGMTI